MTTNDQKTELFDDNRLINTVKNLIKVASTEEMQLLSKTNNVIYRARLSELNTEFAITYPSLFQTITEDPQKFELKRLYEMLEMKKRVKQSKLSYEDASSQIGQKYYEEFAKPAIDNLSKK